MEKKYLYTLKDVVFGLRNIYKIYTNELNKLKEYCEVNDKVEDFYFYVYQSAQRNPELYCDFIERKNNFKALSEKVRRLLSGNDISENTAIYEYDKLVGIIKKSPIIIDQSKKEAFATQVNKIFASDFISSSRKIPATGICSLCECGTLYLRTNNIELIPNDGYALPELFYSPLTDTLTLSETDSYFKVSEFGINKIMEMYFFVDSFTDYHITSMNLEAIKEKSIVIDHFDQCKKIELSITEDNEIIRLSKIRKY